mmetsp:Transcript_27011/g.81483  ORF Transcript_27011/g.81483 Transcript_27011/m.81483 type:complete len:233 (-) Transcript_27011:540-1238(-)
MPVARRLRYAIRLPVVPYDHGRGLGLLEYLFDFLAPLRVRERDVLWALFGRVPAIDAYVALLPPLNDLLPLGKPHLLVGREPGPGGPIGVLFANEGFGHAGRQSGLRAEQLNDPVVDGFNRVGVLRAFDDLEGLERQPAMHEDQLRLGLQVDHLYLAVKNALSERLPHLPLVLRYCLGGDLPRVLEALLGLERRILARLLRLDVFAREFALVVTLVGVGCHRPVTMVDLIIL